MECLKRTVHEMIRNGTWVYKNGIFWICLPEGIVGFDGENYIFPETISRRDKKVAENRIRFILGLDINLDDFYSEISDTKFSFLIDELYGLRSPAAVSAYQALVETIAQQQVNFEFAMRTIEMLVKITSKKVKINDLILYKFPEVDDILRAGERIREAKLGYRAYYVLELSREIKKGNMDFSKVEKMSEEEAVNYMTNFRGIGKWSAELFLTYAFRKNTYPAGDLGIKRGIANIFGKRLKDVKEKDVREAIDPFGKWKSLLAFYIICYDRQVQNSVKRRIKKRQS
ncbi:MAG: DNA-3-methyladenine glycosylase 2 family protein [Archaeoglobus sp.]|nr:MAG: DNA-3-methyladenine glycosylase 2 family protein [Archaeoglobus sp.]